MQTEAAQERAQAPRGGATTAVEQALAVLRATSDGDLLAPSDLCLLQLVVNRGLDVLGEERARRWDYVVAATAGGTYERPWLHGVHNLLKRHDGYVLWKGVAVEHYSFQDMQAERESAHFLGACCRLIEARGQAVSAAALSDVWREVDLGAGLGLARRLVLWSLQALDKGAVVCALDGDSIGEILRSRDVHIDREAARLQLRGGDFRSRIVVTQEDRADALDAISSDRDWEFHARPMRDRASRRDLFDAMREHVWRDLGALDLPTRAQVRAGIVGPDLTAASAQRHAQAIDPPANDFRAAAVPRLDLERPRG